MPKKFNYKNDEELIKLFLSQKNNEFFDMIVIKYAKYIFNFVNQYTKNKQLSEDITQDIFFKVWKNLSKFDTNKSFKTWLFQIARNTIIDNLRKRKILSWEDINNINREDNLEKEFYFNIPLNETTPEKYYQNKEMQDIIKKALEKMSLIYKEILHLRYYEDLTFKEIGEILKIPENTVRSYHRRALLKLKEIINFSTEN